MTTPLAEKSANVAFDIPLDKKHDVTKHKPAIAEKLESWKPPSPTKEDIQLKVSKAQQRRSENITNAVVKSASHNESVDKVHHKKKAEEAAGVVILDEKIQQKQSDATVKRTKLTTRIVKKLSKLNQAKQDRGAKARERSSLDSQELAVKVEQKLSVAADKKEEMETKKTHQVTASNQTKILRAVETKLKVEAAAVERNLALESKLSSARERKECIVSETIEALAQTRSDKVGRVEEARKSHEFAVRELDATIANKIVAAGQRKEKIKQQRDESITVQDRLDRVHDARTRQEAAMKELEDSLTARLESASERKARITFKTVQEVSAKSKAKLDRAAELRKNSEMATLKLREAMEMKLSKAEDSRNEHIAAVADQSRSNNSSFDISRESSPSPSPRSTKEDIDIKLCEAAARREALLLRRAEQAGFKAKSAGLDQPNKRVVVHSPRKEERIEETVDAGSPERVGRVDLSKFNPIIVLWNLILQSFRPVLSIFRKK